ncbi:MAG: glycosyltransferase [Eubacterium sp.]|nr:glycosyltransferase [Eubacterium sp.]
MKIYYIVKNIDKIPSCQYNIIMLKKLKYDVIPVFGQSTDVINSLLESKGIKPYELINRNEKGYSFILKYRYSIKKFLRLNYKKGDLIFIGTGDSAVSLMGIIKKYPYVFCVKELYDHANRIYLNNIISISKSAVSVVACEINRARYMKFEWGLSDIPYVVSNRPYYDIEPMKNEGTIEKTKTIISKIKEKKAIVYQASHIHYAPELCNLAMALKSMNKDYILVLIGNIDREAEIEKIKKIYSNIICTGYIKSPLHMEITGNSYIGITIYQENSLNNLFCAPNKIYEYACYGVPTLSNNVPGLVETVAINDIGVCVDWNSIEDIKKGLEKIELQYEYYKKQSLIYYQKTDNLLLMKEIVDDAVKKINA